MRAIAGPVMLLVVILGFMAWRGMSDRNSPDREFTGLELTGPAPDYEGSCYALSTVLIANGIFGNAPRTWTPAGREGWTLTLERVTQGYNGPAREFTSWTFEKHGQVLRLEKVAASQGLPQERDASLDQLLQAPNKRHSTPVDRCLKAGAGGYRFKPE